MVSQALGVVVVPTGQSGGRNAEEVCGVLDVGETDEFGRLAEEAFRGVRTRGESRIVGRKVTNAALTVKLEGSDDQLDGLGSQRKILDSIRVAGSVDEISGMEASRANAATPRRGEP